MSDTGEHKKSEVALREEEILKFWNEHDIFKKSVDKEPTKGEFVFYEGPPTANGKPGIHHMESRSFKDAVPRYRTMRGYHVRRKAGWDTHGLPVEIAVDRAATVVAAPRLPAGSGRRPPRARRALHHGGGQRHASNHPTPAIDGLDEQACGLLAHLLDGLVNAG